MLPFRTASRPTLLLLATMLATACGGGTPAADSAGSAPGSPARTEAEQLYRTSCLKCHGSAGRARTPMARAIQPAPPDFSQPSWQRSTSDEAIREILRRGGPAVGKSALMVAVPESRLSDDGLDELVAMIREFGDGDVDSDREN